MSLSDFRAKASGTTKHLLKQNTAIDLAHKDQIADSGNIYAGSQQIDCYSNIGRLIILKLLDNLQYFLLVSACF